MLGSASDAQLDDASLERPIAELELPTRARNVLLDAGIHTIGDILTALEEGEESLTQLDGFASKSLADLKGRLLKQGFCLSSSTPKDAPDEIPYVPPAQPREPSRLGVWIYGMIGLAIALLILSILLLTQLGITGYTILDVENHSVSHLDGLTLSVLPPETGDGSLRVRIESVPRLEFLEGSAGRALNEAVKALPPHLLVKSPLYQVQTRGALDAWVQIDVIVPDSAEPWETLDLYTWTGEEWKWVGSELDAKVAGHEFIRAHVHADDVPEFLVLAQAESVVPTVSTTLEPGDDLPGSGGTINQINPTGLILASEGGLAGDPISLAQPVEGASYDVLPVLRNWLPGATVNRALLVEMLTTPRFRQTHVANVVQLCLERDLAGIDVDYRGIEASEQDVYSDFVATLADALHAEGLYLSVVVGQPTLAGGAWDTGGYDWAEIGAAADAVKVPFPADPAAYAVGGQAQQLLDWATARVSRYKLRMLVSSLSVDRSSETVNYVSLEQALAPFGEAVAIDQGAAARVEANSQIEFGLAGRLLSIMPQEEAGTYRLEYQTDDGTPHTVWIGTTANLATKLQWARQYHLGGVAVNDLLDPGNSPGIVDAVAGYRASSQDQETRWEMEIAWTVANDTAIIDRQTLPLTQPGYVWTVLASPGDYSVQAAIAGFEHGSVPIVVVEPGATEAITTMADINLADELLPADELPPAGDVNEDCLGGRYVADVTVPDNTRLEQGEEFVKTWSVQNTGDCEWPDDTVLARVHSELGGPESTLIGAIAPGETVEISINLLAPDEDGTFDGKWRLRTGDTDIPGSGLTAVIDVGEVGPLLVTGDFEMGGQTHTLAHPDQMHYAGMNWVKFQVKWSPGMSGADVAGRIQQAHAHQLKVLLSIPGSAEYPRSINFAAYVEFLRQVAEQGPDGIEVWNEQNIDREWPVGEIDPTAYVQKILAPAYNAIKSVNPNILVISGAPSPTGYFGGCSPAGCDDAPYVAAMLAAGAASYVDCVGIHYNEGILPPSQTSGDPRGNSGYYTRYFWGMVNVYYDAFGGQRQLCFTELGYVSPEGYGSLPANFAWAADTSVSEQAAWLAEAASLSASSAKVRMLIIFNVDFTLWSEQDPQAGYAIIRPGESCPACDTLHAVMGSR